MSAQTARTSAHHFDLDDLMRHLMVVGLGALLCWGLASLVGVASGYVSLSRVTGRNTLLFLLAILVIVFARRTYWEVREWRWKKLPKDERFGFVSPLQSLRDEDALAELSGIAEATPSASGRPTAQSTRHST